MVSGPDVQEYLRDARAFQTLHEQVSALRHYSLNPQQRVRTGLDSIDLLCEGPAVGEVFTFLGRSYSGKSIVAQNIMYHNREKPVIFFSLEMHYLLAIQRLYSIWSDTPNADVHLMTANGQLPDILEEMPDHFHDHLIVDRSALTPGDMVVFIQQYDEMYGKKPGAVIVDYLELISGAKTSGEGWLGTEKVAQEMKELAKEAEVPVFLIHQTNKGEEPWNPPTMDSARGGGFTEADFVVGLWRPHLNPKLGEWDREAMRDEVYFTVLKNRPFGRHNRKPLEFLMTPSLRLVERTG